MLRTSHQTHDPEGNTTTHILVGFRSEHQNNHTHAQGRAPGGYLAKKPLTV